MEGINVSIFWIMVAMVLYAIRIQMHKKQTTPSVSPIEYPNKRKWLSIVGMILLGGGVALSRMLYFGGIPSWIGVDEAGIAYDAFCLATNGTDRYGYTFPVYCINFGGGQSALYTYIATIFVKLFGFSIATIRLPALLMYIASMVCMFYIIAKKDRKPIAWLTVFLILICPWHCIQSRYALDCNLLAPMLLMVIIGLLQAKKWWQYALTGVLIGITLYTYSLSWLILPVCLLVWLMYLGYTKSITWKSILAMGIPAFVFALPLFCFIGVNKGWLPEMQWGWISIPKLYEFRSGEIGIQPIIDVVENLRKLFFKGPLDATNCFYYAEWLLAFIGIGITGWQFGTQVRNRQFVFSHFLLLTVGAIFVSLLFVEDMNTTKANAFYIPMLYFAAIGISYVCQHKKWIGICILLLHCIAFGAFEWYYYTSYDAQSRNVYNDAGLYSISKTLQEQYPEKEVYVFTYNVAQPYIYIAIAKEMPWQEFDETKKVSYIPLETEGNYYVYVHQIGNYHFITGDIEAEKIKIQEDAIYIIQSPYVALQQRLETTMGVKEPLGTEYAVYYK